MSLCSVAGIRFFPTGLACPCRLNCTGISWAVKYFSRSCKRRSIATDSVETADLLEVYYLCLLLGFKGRYAAGGDLRSIMASVQEKIRRVRGPSAALSPRGAIPADAVRLVQSDPWVRRLAIGALVTSLLAIVSVSDFQVSYSCPARLQLSTLAAQVWRNRDGHAGLLDHRDHPAGFTWFWSGSSAPGCIRRVASIWILRGGLWLIGLIAAGSFLWFYRKSKAEESGSETAPAKGSDDLDVLVHEAIRRLKSSTLGRGAKLGNLPLVFLLGDSGSTKTTTIINSALDPELLAGQVYQDNNIVRYACGQHLVHASGDFRRSGWQPAGGIRPLAAAGQTGTARPIF